MLLLECTICGRRELRGTRSLFMVPSPAGTRFAMTCRGCGHDLTLHDGKPVELTATAAA